MARAQLTRWLGLPDDEPCFPDMTLPQLRDYQMEAVDSLLQYGKGTVVLPSGTGKTLVALGAMKMLQVETAIVVPTKPLLHQWIKILRKCNVKATPFYGEEKQLSPCTVFTYNTACKHVDLIIDYFKFIVLDEAHHLMSDKFRKLIKAVDALPYALALTATPERLDGMHKYMLRLMPIVYEMTIYEAEKRGFTSPLEVVPVPVRLTREEAYKYVEYTDTIITATRKLRTANPAELSRIDDPLAKAALRAMQLRKMLLSEAENKIQAVIDIYERHKDEKVILFSESIDSIVTLSAELKARGYKPLLYHSMMNPQERRRSLDKWGIDGRNLLLACRCLDEGIDVPEVRIGIILCTGKTSRQLIQRVGRLIRPRPGKTARVYVIYAEGTIEEEIAPLIRRLTNSTITEWL